MMRPPWLYDAFTKAIAVGYSTLIIKQNLGDRLGSPLVKNDNTNGLK
ncbi:hypothetical protein H6G36_00570 [Anabaena minutissima FACHB-250]|nr:hypothetical protein [Anabaena minutissima FACHB-250]